jgi:hypothetical protein
LDQWLGTTSSLYRTNGGEDIVIDLLDSAVAASSGRLSMFFNRASQMNKISRLIEGSSFSTG